MHFNDCVLKVQSYKTTISYSYKTISTTQHSTCWKLFGSNRKASDIATNQIFLLPSSLSQKQVTGNTYTHIYFLLTYMYVHAYVLNRYVNKMASKISKNFCIALLSPSLLRRSNYVLLTSCFSTHSLLNVL